MIGGINKNFKSYTLQTSALTNFKNKAAGQTGYLSYDIVIPAKSIVFTEVILNAPANSNGLQLTICNPVRWNNTMYSISDTVYMNYYCSNAINYDCNVGMRFIPLSISDIIIEQL